MDQPGNLNSFTPELREQLAAALRQAAQDSSVRAIVLGGSGRFFSAGANLKRGGLGTESIRDVLVEEYKPVFDAVLNAPQPVIAAVQGGAAGIGMSLAMACDLVVLEENAFLLCPFTSIGLVPDGGATWTLTRALGQRAAFEFAISGERMPAARASELNLINRLAATGEALQTAESWAAELALKAPLALTATKKAGAKGGNTLVRRYVRGRGRGPAGVQPHGGRSRGHSGVPGKKNAPLHRRITPARQCRVQSRAQGPAPKKTR